MSEDDTIGVGEKKIVKKGDIAIQIENQTEISKDELWNQTLRWIQQKYQEHGVPFDPNTVREKAELDQHLVVIKNLEGRKEAERKATIPPAPRGGDTAPLSQSQLTGQTTTAVEGGKLEKESEIPLSWLEFDSEEELVATLKKISEDRTDSRSEVARRVYNELTKKVIGKNQQFELQGAVSDMIRKGKKLSMEKVREGEGE